MYTIAIKRLICRSTLLAGNSTFICNHGYKKVYFIERKCIDDFYVNFLENTPLHLRQIPRRKHCLVEAKRSSTVRMWIPLKYPVGCTDK